jgi:hypothetical protein
VTDREDSSHLYCPISIQPLPRTQSDLSPWLECPCLASTMSLMISPGLTKDPTTKLSSSPSVSNPLTRWPVTPLASQKANSTLFIWQSLEAKKRRPLAYCIVAKNILRSVLVLPRPTVYTLLYFDTSYVVWTSFSFSSSNICVRVGNNGLIFLYS